MRKGGRKGRSVFAPDATMGVTRPREILD
jgi:hypothetical protein